MRLSGIQDVINRDISVDTININLARIINKMIFETQDIAGVSRQHHKDTQETPTIQILLSGLDAEWNRDVETDFKLYKALPLDQLQDFELK